MHISNDFDTFSILVSMYEYKFLYYYRIFMDIFITKYLSPDCMYGDILTIRQIYD